MTHLPGLRPRQVAAILLRAGFEYVRQRGSHRIYVKGPRAVTLPWHSRELKTGTLRHIIEQSGLPTEQFLKLR